MAQNISLLGATYSNCPAVLLPKQGGGTARFDDATVTTATASDVANGKIFLAANGTITTGTASGGGGGIGTLLKTEVLGSISISSTNNTDTGKDLSVSGIDSYDMLLVEISAASVVNGRHISTFRPIFLYNNGTSMSGKNYAVLSATWCYRTNNTGTKYSRANTSTYGVFPYNCTVSNGTATMDIYARYSSSYTGTINGSYTAKVYGVKLAELVGL